MTFLAGGLYVALLTVRPALEAVDAGGGRAHVKHSEAGETAEVLWVPGLIESADTFLRYLFCFENISFHEDLTFKIKPLQAAQRGTNLFL